MIEIIITGILSFLSGLLFDYILFKFFHHNAHSKLLRDQEKKQIEKEWEAKTNWDDDY